MTQSLNQADLETYYAPEIEEALVSLCWHKPNYLSQVLRELDPQLHFVQPHLRQVLEAVRLADSELGTCDFAAILQVLTEFSLLEECGGRAGLNELYIREGYESLVPWYILMLKDYATQRGTDPQKPLYHFSGGKLQLFANKAKTHEGEPDVVGEARVAGKRYSAKGWFVPDPDQPFTEVRLYPKPSKI